MPYTGPGECLRAVLYRITHGMANAFRLLQHAQVRQAYTVAALDFAPVPPAFFSL